MFFGSVDQLVRAIGAAWAGGVRCVILDCRRVSKIDLSGARRLLQVMSRYWQAGAEMVALEKYGAGASVAPVEALDMLGRLGLSQEESACLLALAPEHSFAAGTKLMRIGEQADTVYFLIEGAVEVSLPLPGGAHRARLATLTAGALLGEMALLSGAVRSADVTALTPVRCMRLGIKEVTHLRADRPDLAYRLMLVVTVQLATHLRMANVALKAADD